MTMDVETIFIDTNILIYATNDESPFQAKSLDMLNQLMTEGIECTISPQIIREYLVVFTRGVSSDDAARSAALHNIGKFIDVFRKGSSLLLTFEKGVKSAFDFWELAGRSQFLNFTRQMFRS